MSNRMIPAKAVVHVGVTGMIVTPVVGMNWHADQGLALIAGLLLGLLVNAALACLWQLSSEPEREELHVNE